MAGLPLLSSFNPCFSLTWTHCVGLARCITKPLRVSRVNILLTVEKMGYFHQVRHGGLVCVVYDQPVGFGGAGIPVLQEFRDASGSSPCNYVALGSESSTDAVPLFRVLGKDLRGDRYSASKAVTKQRAYQHIIKSCTFSEHKKHFA